MDSKDIWSDDVVPQLELMERTSSDRLLNSTMSKLNTSLKSKDASQLSIKQVQLICLALYRVYTRSPFNSRLGQQVLQTFTIILSLDFDVYSERLSKFVHACSLKPLSPSVELILLRWITHFSAELAKRNDIDDICNCLIPASANIFDHVSQSQGNAGKIDHHKDRIMGKASTEIRLQYTHTLQRIPAGVDRIISTLCSGKLSANSAMANCGLLAQAVEQLKTSRNKPQPASDLTKNASKIVDFVTNKCLSKRVDISIAAANCFGHFVHGFVDSNLCFTILLGLQKSSLRNSEMTYTVLAPAVISAFNEKSIDVINKLVSSKFFPQLISGLQSSKDTVRKGAAESLEKASLKFTSESNVTSMNKLLDELFKVFKSLSATATEQKIYIAHILGSVPQVSSEINEKIVSGLLNSATRDSHEPSLNADLEVIFDIFINSLYGKGFPAELFGQLTDALKQGLQDRRPALRSCWCTSIGKALISTEKSDADKGKNEILKFFSSDMVSLLCKIIDAGCKSPLPSISNGLIVGTYASIWILQYIKHSITDETVLELINNLDIFKLIEPSDASKISIFEDLRVLEKLIERNQQFWFIKALYAVAAELPSTSGMLGYAILFSCASETMLNEGQSMACKLVHLVMKQHQAIISNSCVEALNRYIYQDTTKKLVLKANSHYLYEYLLAITEPFDNEDPKILDQILINILLPCHYDNLAQIGNGWAGICQKSKVDPGSLARSHADEIIKKITNPLIDSSTPDPVYNAALRAAATVSFVAPDVIVPKLIDIISEDLDCADNLKLDDETLKIWQAKEGELAVDVLKKRGGHPQLRKNTKDYETLKWEQGVRDEIAAKKQKSERKLTQKERMLVEEERSREAKIRETIQTESIRLNRGLKLIISLSESASLVDNDANEWFPVAVSKVLKLMKLDAGKLVGDLAVRCYLTIAKALTNTGLTGDSSFESIGSTTLRLYGVEVPEQYRSQDLTKLIGTQLFSVKLSSDKTQLSSLALMYILPLLVKVMERGERYALQHHAQKRIEQDEDFIQEAPEEVQLSLALSIISSNSDGFEDTAISRTDLLRNLIKLMTIPSKAQQAKDCFVPFAQAIAIEINDSDLQILLDASISSSSFVRTTMLEEFDQEYDLSTKDFIPEIWIANFDPESSNRTIANTIWQESKFTFDSASPSALIQFLSTEPDDIRHSVAKAVAECVKQLKSKAIFDTTIDELLDIYRKSVLPSKPETDKFGNAISLGEPKDKWEVRSGVALTIQSLADQFIQSKEVEKVFRFMVGEEPLIDKNTIVRQQFEDAGLSIINAHGKANVEVLIPIFESGLSLNQYDAESQDRLKEGVIVLYGSLAKHLNKKDNRVEAIMARLLKALETPSEDVQFRVSQCISPLVGSFADKLQEYFDDLFEKLYNGEDITERKGAAYGIAGLAKGGGLKMLSKYHIIDSLEEASEDRDPKKREGVIFAIECLSESFGSLFEAYVLELLPIVLKSFGDSSPEVRKATGYAAKQIMRNTTSYGIQKLIPIAVQSLGDISWRAKKGSVQLLGSMAYMDPAQLSIFLPKIVPEIISVLNDSHKEVRKAADKALKKFGEVIRNPEIKAVVPTLMKAISDPTKYTEAALDGLIHTQFVHYIDGPSLALIIHVVDRGMHEHSGSTKKKSAQIIGNMSILVDTRDLIPYLPKLISELQESIVDTVPQTRAMAARALGTLVERLGEEKFPGLISKLLQSLKDTSRPADRMGSAQALSEVIRGLGIPKLEELLPQILSETRSPDSYVREGYLPMLLFLPACFGAQFAPYLSRTIPSILNGLADPDDDIRDTALKAGRLIVARYANKAVDLLLPELEKGMSDDNSRIRLSSVELTGDLLFKISGISGNQALSEDPTILANVNRTFNKVLGDEKRNKILSALFVCRSDTSGNVRIGAGNIWKALVANTPKTIKHIMPELTQLIVRRLASPVDEQRRIAASALGDMSRRAGSNALSQLLPTLEKSLISSDSDAKQGICIALHELIESSDPAVIDQYQEILVRIIRSTLTDGNPSVRESAAQAFDALQGVIGHSAVDEVIPQLLEKLDDSEESADALSALQQIMRKESYVVFPVLLPKLLKPHIKAKALGALSRVAGHALYRNLQTIFHSLVNAILDGEGDRDELLTAMSDVTLSVDSEEGCHPLMQQIMGLMRDENHDKQKIMFAVLPKFFQQSKLDYSVYVTDIVTQCIYALDDDDKEIAKNSFLALSALVGKLSKSQLDQLVEPAEETVSLIGKDKDDMYAFSLPRGPNCLLPIFLRGLMYGDSHRRELSANGIAFIIKHTPAANLRPFTTIIVGPLIRVVGERFSGDVKSAILLALNLLFDKIPQFLRPFIPQLQRTFIKSLSDTSNKLLRTRAAKALGTLIKYQPRVDPLILELLNGAKAVVSPENVDIQTSILKALLEVVDKAGSKMSERCKNGILSLIENEAFKEEVGEDTVTCYAKLTGCLSKVLKTDEAVAILREKVIEANLQDTNSSRFGILVLNAFLKDSPDYVFTTGLFDEICTFLVNGLQSDMAYVSDNSTIACGKLLLSLDKLDSIDDHAASIGHVISQLCISVESPASKSVDTRRLSLVVLRTICRYQYDSAVKPYLDITIPSVFACIRDPLIPIKLAAEKCMLAELKMIEDEDNTIFKEWFASKAGVKTVTSANGKVIQMRSITEYIKRVGTRLANVERERLSAGGDKEAMLSDQFEDEREIWAVGGVDLSKTE